jgi:hypothetical protein
LPTIALVEEDGSVEDPRYLPDVFSAEPGWGVTSVDIGVSDFLSRTCCLSQGCQAGSQ